MIDLVITKIELLNYTTYQTLRQIGPFGAGNPEPTFKMEHLRLLDKWTSGFNKQNLRLRLAKNKTQPPQSPQAKPAFDVIQGTYTRGAARGELLAHATHVNVIFQLAAFDNDINPDAWLKILDVEPCSE